MTPHRPGPVEGMAAAVDLEAEAVSTAVAVDFVVVHSMEAASAAAVLPSTVAGCGWGVGALSTPGRMCLVHFRAIGEGGLTPFTIGNFSALRDPDRSAPSHRAM
jgi:hypothetical protein